MERERRITPLGAAPRGGDGSLLPTADTEDADLYTTNIQIADLNALSATLAVIRFKQHLGFYCAEQSTFNSLYFVDGNEIANEA